MILGRGEPLNYSGNIGGARTPRTFATVSFLCWAAVIMCIATHVLIVETPSLRGLEPGARRPLMLGELLLFIAAVVAGIDGTLRRGRRRWLAVLSLVLCLLTIPAVVALFVLRYAPA